MKLTIKTTLFAALFSIAIGAQAQVDPGIAANNYKHPNKAKKAQAKKETFEVATLSHIEKQENAKMSHKIVTPKYAKRHVALTTTRPVEGGGVKVNPMASPDNYKATKPAVTKEQAASEEFASTKDSPKDGADL